MKLAQLSMMCIMAYVIVLKGKDPEYKLQLKYRLTRYSYELLFPSSPNMLTKAAGSRISVPP